MMDKYLHQNYPLEERAQILRDSADFTEEGASYTRTLTENELTIEREHLAEASIKRSEIEDEKKEVVKDYKAKLDPLNDQISEHLQKIKTGKEEIKGSLHGFKDHEDGTVYFYDDNGEMVYSRRLRANEAQKTVMSVLRDAK